MKFNCYEILNAYILNIRFNVSVNFQLELPSFALSTKLSKSTLEPGTVCIVDLHPKCFLIGSPPKCVPI